MGEQASLGLGGNSWVLGLRHSEIVCVFLVESWDVSRLAVTSMLINHPADLCVPMELTANAGGTQCSAKFTACQSPSQLKTESKSLGLSWA